MTTITTTSTTTRTAIAAATATAAAATLAFNSSLEAKRVPSALSPVSYCPVTCATPIADAVAVAAAVGVKAAAAQEFPTVKISLACAPCVTFVPCRPTRRMRNIRTAGHTVPTGPVGAVRGDAQEYKLLTVVVAVVNAQGSAATAFPLPPFSCPPSIVQHSVRFSCNRMRANQFIFGAWYLKRGELLLLLLAVQVATATHDLMSN